MGGVNLEVELYGVKSPAAVLGHKKAGGLK